MGRNTSFWRPLKDIEATGEDVAVKMGCPEPKGSRQALAWLRSQPASKLLEHSGDFAAAAYGGRVLPEHPARALQEGHFNPVPVISGYNRDEARAMALGMQLLNAGKAMTDAEFQQHLTNAFAGRSTQVQAQYPRSPSPTLTWSAIYTDRMFACPQLAANR